MREVLLKWIERFYSTSWDRCEREKSPTLLRLSILRDILRTLHSEKSRALAQGDQPALDDLKEAENTILLQLKSTKLEGSLRAFLNSEIESGKSPSLFSLPQELFQVLDKQKLSRLDRKLESLLITQALHLSWIVWHLELWIEVPAIESWNTRLVQEIWPHGIVLFTESAKTPSIFSPGSKNQPDLWFGRWVLLFDPEKNPIDLYQEQIFQWEGFPSSRPNEPLWRQLFPFKESRENDTPFPK